MSPLPPGAASQRIQQILVGKSAPSPRARKVEKLRAKNPNTKLSHRILWKGLSISVENAAGSIRKKENFSTRMKNDYGYIRGTLAQDKDHIDCYLGSDLDSPVVFIVHQRNARTLEYDEDKVMIGFDSSQAAIYAYLCHFPSDAWFGAVTPMDSDDFAQWCKNPDNRANALVPRAAEKVKLRNRMRGKEESQKRMMLSGLSA